MAILDAHRGGERSCVWEDPAITSVATPIIASEIGALPSRAVDREVHGVLHFAGVDGRRALRARADGGSTVDLLGLRAYSIVEQLDALRNQVEVGAPSPLN